ncbi:MAG: hypothetical protein FJ137_05935 [Deltaproteobacteria bacterium]|nr:hypothetical protein [Deltaproteobacteria bacterium]
MSFPNHALNLAGAIMNSTRFLPLLAVALGVTLGAACGEAVDINRVAPNVVDKSVFTGEWYVRSAIVDKQFHTDTSFIGLQGEVERIKWEITERQLIGYRSYERVPGSDPSNPGEQNVIVAFPILRHFDIRRQYNPVNGVETNVIEENDYDRPWYERQYVRVGWNDQNGVAWALDNQIGLAFIDSLNRRSNETPSYPWKVRIGDKLITDQPIDSGDSIDVTLDAITDADPYICYYLDGVSPCNGANVKVKFSFRRVDENNEYQALDYPDYVERKTGTLQLVSTGEDILSSGALNVINNPNLFGADFEPPSRLCTPAEMDRDGTRTVKVVFDDNFGGRPRMCNTNPGIGDPPSACEEALARCNVPEGENNLVAITPGSGVGCDPNIHSPDDCIELTTPVFGRFGYFRTDRYQTDRENGTQYNARERLINRHNIWADILDDGGASIPMDRRPVKPVVYMLNVGFPTDLIDIATKDLADDWNVAFLEAVAAARGVGLSSLPKNLNEGIDGAKPVTRMFEVRINSCNVEAARRYTEQHDMGDALVASGIATIQAGNLENACAVLEFESQRRARGGEEIEPFRWEQLGDLRYSFLNWTSKAELAGPLGYGPSGTDPLTGEIISANANVYGASIDTYANWGADIVQLLNGDVTTGDIINGTLAREHVESVRARWAGKKTPAAIDNFLRTFDRRAAGMSDDQYFVRMPTTALGRGLDKLRESGLEDEYLLTSETLRLFGNDPMALRNGVVTDRMRENARPSNWAREQIPDAMLVAANAGHVGGAADEPFVPSAGGSTSTKLGELSDYLGRKNFCFLAEQVEPAIADLATKIKADGMSREQIVQFIRANVFRGVMAHELGHTFGLRHNFEGSADALNYFPDYWGVGADGLSADQQHLLSKTPYDVVDGKRREYQYSSIMDYHQRFNSDFGGIGLYDKAAIKLGYAETVEVFDENPGDEFVAREWMGNIFLLNPADIPNLVAGHDADAVINDAYDEANEAAVGGDDTVVLDIANLTTLTPAPENLYRRRNIPLKDWFRNEVLGGFVGGLDDNDCERQFGLPNERGCMSTILGGLGYNDDDGSLPKVSVPYSYCADEFAFGGNLTCNRWDMGPTSSDIVSNAGEMYEFYYPFDAFRRERALNPFSSWANGYINRLFSRTYQPMLNAYRYFYYYRRANGLRIFPTIRDWGSAALTGMDFFVRVLEQPEPGTYCLSDVRGTQTYVPADEATGDECATDSIELGLDQGRIFNSNWDDNYDFRPINLGNYWDKALALQAITSSDAFFFRDFSQETNRGAFSIGYYRIFQDEMLDLFGAVMRDDPTVFAPHVVDADNDGKGEVVYAPFLKTGIYGEPLPEAQLPGAPIKPAMSYQLRTWAAIFGTVNMTSTLDQTLDFAQRTRITMVGQPGEPTLQTDIDGDGTDDIDVIEFTDPQSHMVYRSVAFDGVEHAVGYRLLQEAEEFADAWRAAQAALQTAEAGGDAAAVRAAQIAFDRATSTLNERLQTIDFMVYLGNAFEYPGG